MSLTNRLIGQTVDTTHRFGRIPHDTVETIVENIPRNKSWGNSWYIAAASNFSSMNEFNLSIGRTYGASDCGGASCVFTMRSWGMGYSFATKNGQTNKLANAFWEYSFFYMPPIAGGFRADYIFDITNQSHYLRPSFGLSLFYIDVFYNYSFNISGTENLFKNGVTLRIKWFHEKKNWQLTHRKMS